MGSPKRHYWRIRLDQVKKALEGNGFEVFIAENGEEARDQVLEKILPATNPKIISWGGSQTFIATGLFDSLKSRTDMKVLDTFDASASAEEVLERRRRALLVDLFLTGTNAVTESGMLVNLDMVGNRVAAITFGPRHVVILAGRNKIVPDLEEAVARIKDYAAPANAMRLDKKTPCAATSHCEDCGSPERICNSWTITEKSFPKGRIRIVLINEELGL
ncbi:lactate utilization protein [Thermodesulfobacteriota bacterium]